MKVTPLRTYRTPEYPTIVAAGCAKDLLSRIPRRWQESPRFAALLGVGLMVKTLMAGGDVSPSAGSQAPTTQSPGDANSVPGAKETAKWVRKATTLVAPVLAEALQHDGRGSIGCIAVNPPTFLSEAEALELIRNELKAAGLGLKAGAELDGIVAPAIGAQGLIRPRRSSRNSGFDAVAIPAVAARDPAASLARPAGKIETRDWPGVGGEPELVSRKFLFDFGDPNRAVYVEYLSPRDYTTWMGRSMSTVQGYDFPALTRKVSESLGKHKSDKRTVFGVFFDPLVRVEYLHVDTSGLDPSQRRMVWEEAEKARQRAWDQRGLKGQEKLRRQVRHFVAFLRQEGVIPAAQPQPTDMKDPAQGQAAHAPDAASH